MDITVTCVYKTVYSNRVNRVAVLIVTGRLESLPLVVTCHWSNFSNFKCETIVVLYVFNSSVICKTCWSILVNFVSRPY